MFKDFGVEGVWSWKDKDVMDRRMYDHSKNHVFFKSTTTSTKKHDSCISRNVIHAYESDLHFLVIYSDCGQVVNSKQ